MDTSEPVCPYCQGVAKLVTGEVLYPGRQDLWSLRFWMCQPCESYVGCHKSGNGYGDGTRPLGTLANAVDRKARNEAHKVFDKLWQFGGMSRKQAYLILATKMGLPVVKVHFGSFNGSQCARALKICNKLMLEI